MKTMVMTILAVMSLNGFAGILENRQTGESIEFTLNRHNRSVEVISTAADIPNGTLYLKNVEQDQYDFKKFELHKAACYDDDGTCALLYFIGIGEVMLVADLATLGFRAVFTAPIKNSRYKKDFKMLMKAINSNTTQAISNSRFNRVEKMLGQVVTE